MAGHNGWVWHDDSKIGEYTLEEIADNIKAFHHFLYVCTAASHESEGQKKERNWALTFGKDPIVIMFDRRDVSPVLALQTHIPATNVDFQRACDAAAVEITKRLGVKVPAVAEEAAADDLRLPTTISEVKTIEQA